MSAQDKISAHRAEIGQAIQTLLSDIAGEHVGFGLLVRFDGTLNSYISNMPVENSVDVLEYLVEQLKRNG